MKNVYLWELCQTRYNRKTDFSEKDKTPTKLATVIFLQGTIGPTTDDLLEQPFKIFDICFHYKRNR